MSEPGGAEHYVTYMKDGWQRSILFLDTLCPRDDSYIEREREGFKPVLAFVYEVVVDGRPLERPVNDALVCILPPEGFPPPGEPIQPINHIAM